MKLPTLTELRRVHDRAVIVDRLTQFYGNITASARSLGISREHLARLIAEYEINRAAIKSSQCDKKASGTAT